ncbi:MAG: hypothetical protein CMJ85_13450 [Planctomycetes bacterium]|jgi:zinc protease|nr:hypothetical protein [Planctomycetota bacterium]MDP6424382.1 pitrilysin family protein [Planctomycetota bacterium]
MTATDTLPVRGLMRDVTHEVLDNGLRVFLVESRELPVVSHMIWYTVGARDERTGETGLSHFLEHMMFKGTADYPKGTIDAITARLGGHNNAFTDSDCTAYYFNLKSDRWTEALAIEASRMQGCLLDQVEFESEKKVVIEELQMGEDEPWRPLWQGVESMAFRVHPYRHPIIGWREELERLQRDTMEGYYRRHYTPDRAVLVVVGDIDASEGMARIQEQLGGIPRAPAPRADVLQEPPQTGERRITVRFNGNMVRCAIAWHTCKVGDRADPVLDLASQLLSGGKAARLYRHLIQGREIAAEVQAYNEARLDPGLFWVIAEGKPQTKPEDLEAAILEEINRFASEGPTARELKRARKQILTSFWFDLETVQSQAMRLGRYEATCEDGWKVLQDYPAQLETITAKEIRDTVKRFLHDDNKTTGWSLPRNGSNS